MHCVSFIFKVTKSTLTILFCMLLSSCYTPPFRDMELTRISKDVVPEKAAACFDERTPETFETENTVIFRFSRLFFTREIAALGYARVDSEEESFDIVCISHLGAQIFHIKGDRHGNHLIHAIPELKEIPGFTDAVGNAIRFIYFDLTPALSAHSEIKRDRITFQADTGRGALEHVLAGQDKLLWKKIARDEAGRREATFYEYFTVKDDDGRSFQFPRGVVFYDRSHSYRLIVRTRSINLK